METTLPSQTAPAVSDVEQEESLGLLQSWTLNSEAESQLLAKISTDEPFFVVDLNNVRRQYATWQRLLPNIQAFYAVKCNSDPNLLSTLASLGASFDCASPGEIRNILGLGVAPSRIIFANPIKADSWITFAGSKGIRLMTFDNKDELYKIKRLAPTALVIIRIFADDSTSKLRLGQKFGTPLHATMELLQLAKSLNLEVAGISFHIGSGSTDATQFCRSIADARTVYDQAVALGHRPYLLDLGGGFNESNFPAQAAVIAKSMEDYFGMEERLRVIAEPGRLFASGASTLFCKVIGRRFEDNLGLRDDERIIYLNDGVFGNLMNAIIEPPLPSPYFVGSLNMEVLTQCDDANNHGRGLSPASSMTLYDYVVWGRTCDSADIVMRSCKLPDIQCNDWLAFPNMGGKQFLFPQHYKASNSLM